MKNSAVGIWWRKGIRRKHSEEAELLRLYFVSAI